LSLTVKKINNFIKKIITVNMMIITESQQHPAVDDSTAAAAAATVAAAPVTRSSKGSQTNKARVVKIAAVKGKQAETKKVKKEEPKLMKKARTRAKKLSEPFKLARKRKSQPSAPGAKAQSGVKLKRPACLLQPTISYTCYLCQNCWNDTRSGPVEKIGDKLLMAISMCDACVGLNAQYRSLYFGGTA